MKSNRIYNNVDTHSTFDESSSIRLSKDVDKFIEDVGSIKLGAAGCSIALGLNTHAIFTHENTKVSNTMMIAGQHGRGRFLFATHNSLIPMFKDQELFRNHVCKLLCGTTLPDSEIVDLSDMISFPVATRLLLIDGNRFTKEVEVGIMKYISNGGALVCGLTPWAFTAYKKKPLNVLVSVRIMARLGVIVVGCYGTQSPPDGFNASNSNYFYKNVWTSLKELQLKPNMSFLFKCLQGLNDMDVSVFEDSEDLKTQLLQVIKRISSTDPASMMFPLKNADDVSRAGCLNIFMLLQKAHRSSYVVDFPGIPNNLDKQALTDVGTIKNLALHVFSKLSGKDKIFDNGLGTFKLQLQTRFRERVSTGLYCIPGQLMHIECCGNIGRWNVQIGCHTDELFGKSTLLRYPLIFTTSPLHSSFSLSSPFGGLLYFNRTDEGKDSLTVSIHGGVCMAISFDLCKGHTKKHWQEMRKQCNGPWGEIAGHHIIFSLPLSSLLELEDPHPWIRFWDEIVKSHCSFKSISAGDYKRERVVFDIQPCMGYMHSGYPIVLPLTILNKSHSEYPLDVAKLRKDGFWGLFHELGHNMQSAAWTFPGSVEVTCNWFSLNAGWKVCGIDVWNNPWLERQKSNGKDYLRKDETYDVWKRQAGVALIIFAEIMRDFGTKLYTFVLESYKANQFKPSNEVDDVVRLINEFSQKAHRNITPAFALWNFPDEVIKQLSHLNNMKPWIPDDEVTEVVPLKIKLLKERYSIPG